MIAPLDTGHMLPSELHTAAERIINVIEENISDKFVLKLCRLFKADINALKEAIKSHSDDVYAQRLMQKDQERDKAFLAFQSFLIASSKRHNKKIRSAAVKLMAIVKNNGGNISSLENSLETIKLHALFSELKSAEAKPLLQIIHGEEWFDELFECQLRFEQVYNESSLDVQKKIPVIIKAMLKSQKRLATIIECVAELDELDQSVVTQKAVKLLNKIIFDETNYIENRLISNHSFETD